MLGFDENNIIEFGKIQNIFQINNELYFQIKKLQTFYFDSHYQAYCISSMNEKNDVIINVVQIPKFEPCLYVRKLDKEFVAMRFDFIS